MDYRGGRPNIPYPPDDPEHRKTIEKFASFVAKNGPAFEERARTENYGNPRFAFLVGGDYSDYYRYCVDMELQAGKYPDGPPGLPPGAPPQHSHPPPQQPANPSFDVAQAQAHIEQLRQQIRDSEANLAAHLAAVPIQKEAQLAVAIQEAEEQKVNGYLVGAKLDIAPFDQLLEQFNGKCSKDAVANLKKWIFENCTTDQHREVILSYLTHRVRNPQVPEAFRIHVLYLINDWAYYCQRKKLDHVRQMLSRYVPQLYAYAADGSKDPANTGKLEKLTGVWEGHKYFDDNCFKQLRNPAILIQNARSQLQANYQKLATQVQNNLMATYATYEKQHQEFAQHVQNQITAIEAQIEMEHNRHILPPPPMAGSRRSRFDTPGDYGRFFNNAPPPPPKQDNWRPAENWGNSWREEPEDSNEDVDGQPLDAHPEESITPTDMYYNLPASTMVDQVNIEDLTFEAIDPKKLRLPPPGCLFTPRIHAALDRFFAPPTPDTPRDGGGWEKPGILDFIDRKQRLRKILDDKEGGRFEDLITNRPTANDFEEEKQERESEKKRKLKAAQQVGRRRSRSTSRSRSRSRSSSGSPRDRRRSRSRTRSPPRRKRSSSRSASPEGRPSFGGALSPPRARSPSPPKFARPAVSFRLPAPLTSDNKGAILMQKMGWQGKGLGVGETGIQEPITGGEVRDRNDQFRGVGSRPDEFEEYRKQRSGIYHERASLYNSRKID